MALKYLPGRRIEGLTADTKPATAEEGTIYKDIETGEEFRMESTVWVPKPTGGVSNIDQLTDVDTATDTPDNNDVLTYSTASSKWVPAQPPGAGGGEANTISNVGSGAQIAKAKVGVDIPVRSLLAGTSGNVTITQNTNDITIEYLRKFTTSYTYTIYIDGGSVKARNNFTGAVTSNANIDPLITTILASGNPSFEVLEGTYTLHSSFTGFTVPNNATISLDNGAKFYVPDDYASYIWKFGANIQYVKFNGGYFDEAGASPSSSWDCFLFEPGLDNGIAFNTIRDVHVVRANCAIKLKTANNSTQYSWVNSNYFENILANRCKWIGIWDHTGDFANTSGTAHNTFVNVNGQAFSSAPQALGGFKDVNGSRNMFISCAAWDLFPANASAVSMNIVASAINTTIMGGIVTDTNFADLGTETTIIDTAQGFKTKKELKINRTAGSFETLLTAGVTDTTDKLTLENLYSTSAMFSPLIRATVNSAGQTASLVGMYLQTIINNSNDTGTAAVNVIEVKKTDNSAVTNRILLSLRSGGTAEYDFYASQLDLKTNALINATINADSNTITNIEDADIKASAGILTSKLADSANFILKTLDNAFGAHYQDITKMTAPASPGANDIRLYVDTADTKLKIKNNAGTVVDLHDKTPSAHAVSHKLDGSDALVLKGLRTGYLLVNTTPVTLSATTDQLVKVDATGGARTVNLPTAASIDGQFYTIIKSDSGANTVTIDAASSETINGSLTYVLTAQYQTVTLRSDGTNWLVTPYSVVRRGKTTATGNGSATTFNVPHGLGVDPHDAIITCRTHTIATYSTTSTNIVVVFGSAPANAASIVFDWSAVP